MPKKTILITGSSDGGLGAALCHAFHKAGWRVFATARNLSKMASLTSAFIETLTLDVLDPSSLAQCADQVAKLTGGSLDCLVNNAGGGYCMPVVDIDIAEMKKLFDLNVFSIISTTGAFLPLLRKIPEGAMVVNQTSVASVLPVPFSAAYNSSKAAAAMITSNLRLELDPFGIKVVDLKTGVVKTNFFNNVGDSRLPTGSIYQAARQVVEKQMSGYMMDAGEDVDIWAANVVRDLSQKTPPPHIYRGKDAGFAKFLAAYAPSWFLDREMKKWFGFGSIEKKVTENRKTR